jgi:hypothetical protein
MAQPGLAPDINLLEAMDIFKNFPDEELPNYRNDPKLALVAAAEMDRRLRIRKDFEAKQQKPSGPIIDQLQQQLMAPPMQQPMGPPMQPMGQPMAQPEMPQQGLGALVPGMAQGGPVAFQFGGGVGAEFGGSSEDALAADEERRQRLIRDRKLQEDRQRYEFLVNAGATQQAQQLAQQNPEAAKPAPVAAAKPAEQKPADQTQGQNAQLNDLIRQLIAQRGQQQQPAAPAPVDLKGLANLAKDYMPKEVPVKTAQELRQMAEEEERYQQKKFGDPVSPIMEQLAKAAGEQVSPEEARRRAFMKAGIAGLGYQGRDFGAGLAGMLEGYQSTKEGIEASNKEARTLELKARLANEQYKDAVKRKDYESAKKYATEVAKLEADKVEAENKVKLGKLGVMGAMQDLTTPKRVAGTGAASQKGALTEDQYIRAKERALERAQPKLAELDKEFDKRSKQWFGSNKLPPDWKQDKDAMKEYTSRKKRIIDEAFEEVQRPAVLDLTNPEILKKILQLTPNK